MSDPGPVEDDILINKLRPGHELEMKLFAVKVTVQQVKKKNSQHVVITERLTFVRVWDGTMPNSRQWQQHSTASSPS
jgi:hypothetical protein